MSALVWGAWGEEWSLNEKVSFNGHTRKIVVNSGVTTLILRTDVYSAWVRWMTREENSRFLPAIRGVGGDPIPGGETGLTFFLYNGWKLIYNPAEVSINGVLYSEDYETAFWSESGAPLYPTTVSSLVNQVTSYQNVLSGDPSSIALAVRQALQAELSNLDAKVSSRASQADVWAAS